MLPLSAYNNARHEARFHVQIQFGWVEAIPPGPTFLPVTATVLRVFRGGDALKLGDSVTFKLPVTWPGDELPCGGVIWKSYPEVDRAAFAEAFLNDGPPRCSLALWQIELIDAPSDSPRMQGRFPIVHLKRGILPVIARWFQRNA